MTRGDTSRGLLRPIGYVIYIGVMVALIGWTIQPIVAPEPPGAFCGTAAMNDAVNTTGQYHVLNETVVANNSTDKVSIYVEAPAGEKIMLWNPRMEYLIDVAEAKDDKTALYAPSEPGEYQIFLEGAEWNRTNVTVEAPS